MREGGAEGSSFPLSTWQHPPGSAGSGCTAPSGHGLHPSAPGRKIQGIFQLAFKHPRDYEVFGFFMRKTSFLFELMIP